MIRRSKYCALAVFTHLIYLSPSKYKFSVISVSSKRITRMPLEVIESHTIATVSASQTHLDSMQCAPCDLGKERETASLL